MYEIALICLDSFICSEISKLNNYADSTFNISYSIQSVDDLLEQRFIEPPDIALIDCDNAGRRTLEAARIIKKVNNHVKIIVIGDKTKQTDVKLYMNLINEDVYRFYDKVTFLADYTHDIGKLKVLMNEEHAMDTATAEALQVRDFALINNYLQGWYTVDSPVFSGVAELASRLRSFNSYYVGVIGISVEADIATKKSILMLWRKILYSSTVDYFNERYDCIISMREGNCSLNMMIRIPENADGSFEDALFDDCQKFIEYINSSNMFKINIGLSCRFDDIGLVHSSYNQAVCAYCYLPSFSNIDNLVVRYKRLVGSGNPDSSFMQKQKNNLLVSILTKDIDVISKAIDEAFDSVLDRRYRARAVNSLIESIANSCMTAFNHPIETDIMQKFWDAFGYDGYIYTMSDIREIKKVIIKQISALINTDDDPKGRKLNVLIERIKSSVENNYSNPDFTVEQIAKDLFMNYSYICSAFKKETGTTISQYLKNHRMDRAIELMHTGIRDIAKVTSMVGFSDISYFSKCFKQYFGVTPRVYIKQKF